MSSDPARERDSLPSRVVTLSSMSRALFSWLGRCRRLSVRASLGRTARELELSRLRHAVRKLLLHRVAYRDPAAFDAGNGALDQDQSALDIGLYDLQVQSGHALDAQVPGHLLVLERLAGILPAAGRSVRAVRDGHAVARPQPGKIPALHRAGKTLAGGCAGHVDILTDDEMVGRDLGADRDQPIGVDAKLGALALRLDLGDGEMAAVGLGGTLHFAQAGAELERHVAVLLLGAVGDNLAIAEPEHRHRHVLAGIGEQPRHPDLLRDHPGTHCKIPFAPQSLISTSTPAARSSFISASTVCGVGSTMSRRRRNARISKCARLLLST